MKVTKLSSGNYRVRIFVKTASGKQIRKSFTGLGKKRLSEKLSAIFWITKRP